MDKLCTVPKENFYLTGECCGLPAAYEIGHWFVCEGHKVHYCDPNKWFGKSLKGEGEEDDKAVESECKEIARL